MPFIVNEEFAEFSTNFNLSFHLVTENGSKRGKKGRKL